MSQGNRERTVNNDQNIQNAIGIFQDIISCLEDIIKESGVPDNKGKSMSRVCQEHGINYLNLRRFIKSVNTIYSNKIIDKESIDIGNDIYRKLYRDFFGIEKDSIEIEYPIDIKETIDIALDSLTERQKQFIISYYFDDLTFAEVGDLYNVSVNRARQIIAKALRILRYHYSKDFNYGHTQAEINRKEEEEEKLVVLKENIQKLEEKKQRNEKLREEIINKAEIFKEIPISKLVLSVRATNILTNMGIDNLYQLFFLSKEEFLSTKNAGIKSYYEIKTKMDNFIYDAFGIRLDEFPL